MFFRSGSLLIISSALALTACSKKESVESAPAVPAVPGVPAVDDTEVRVGTTRDALMFMGRGDEEPARQILEGILKRNPNNKVAKKFLDQLIVDPVTLLGAENYQYRVQSGDTMSSIAQTRLGDSSLFYALARYNGIDDPRRINAGQMLRIPGTKPVPEKSDAKSRPAKSVGPASPSTKTDSAGQSRPAANPRRASQLRAQGLAALNRGSVSQAVNLLSQANRLDPTNQAIIADLNRARHIQRTVEN